jgi:hypothetical protein
MSFSSRTYCTPETSIYGIGAIAVLFKSAFHALLTLAHRARSIRIRCPTSHRTWFKPADVASTIPSAELQVLHCILPPSVVDEGTPPSTFEAFDEPGSLLNPGRGMIHFVTSRSPLVSANIREHSRRFAPRRRRIPARLRCESAGCRIGTQHDRPRRNRSQDP